MTENRQELVESLLNIGISALLSRPNSAPPSRPESPSPYTPIHPTPTTSVPQQTVYYQPSKASQPEPTPTAPPLAAVSPSPSIKSAKSVTFNAPPEELIKIHKKLDELCQQVNQLKRSINHNYNTNNKIHKHHETNLLNIHACLCWMFPITLLLIGTVVVFVIYQVFKN